MSPEPSLAGHRKARTSASSSKKSSELSSVLFLFLDLTPGNGNLLGLSYWDILSPWLGDASTLNTGVSPRDVRESSLSQILEERPHHRYYLTRKACRGILRRAFEREKSLPSQLKEALEIQAGIQRSVPTQKDEAFQHPIGVDGKHACTTGQLSHTLGTGCGSPTNRNNIMVPVAFAQNQRNEVRDLKDVAGALAAQPGMKQQTFIAGTYEKPSVLCLNDQGGQVMACSENIAGTLRAQEHGHQPLLLSPEAPISNLTLYENHSMDSRYTGPLDIAPTMSAKYGTGGNNTPLINQPNTVFCIVGNTIDREPENGGNGLGCQEDIAYTLTATDKLSGYPDKRSAVVNVSFSDGMTHRSFPTFALVTVPLYQKSHLQIRWDPFTFSLRTSHGTWDR